MRYILNEDINPDNIVFNGGTHKFTDSDSYAFAIFNNGQIMWAHHSGLSKEEFLLSTASGKLYGEYNKYKEFNSNYPDDFISTYKQLKSGIKYEGRMEQSTPHWRQRCLHKEADKGRDRPNDKC